MKRSATIKPLVLCVVLAWVARSAHGALNPEQVVIVANADVRESRRLAMHYAEKRAIPKQNICLLSLPTNEVISRKLYEDALRDPLSDFLRKRGLVVLHERDPKRIRLHENRWSARDVKVRAIVLMYGVPVRIEDTRWLLWRKVRDRSHAVSEKDTAAVESELALMLAAPYRIGGYVPNPLFRRLDTANESEPTILMVTRLDGPGPDIVQRLIDVSIAAEKSGLCGRGYFDAMGSRGGGYYMGDYWIREACNRFEREGIECVLDDQPRLFGEGYPMEDAAVYFGWYNQHVVGPMSRSDFRFAPGTLAAHIHSTSAMRLRTETEYWVGPLLARGACATWGAVSEPYLSGMPHLDILADRLCSGWTFGESIYAALPVLSWQVAVVGDPLYRPFRGELDELIMQLESGGDAAVQWAYVRKVNLLAREGHLKAALDYARTKSVQGKYPALMEKLGDLLAKNEMWDEAADCYEQVLRDAQTVETAVRVALRAFPVFKQVGRAERAVEWGKIIRDRWPDHPVTAALADAQASDPTIEAATKDARGGK